MGVQSPWNILLALRTWVLGTWMLLWVGSALAAQGISGWDTKLIDGPGRWVAVAALGGTSVLALAINMSERMQERVLEPTRRELFDPAPFLFLGLLAGALAGSFAFAAS